MRLNFSVKRQHMVIAVELTVVIVNMNNIQSVSENRHKTQTVGKTFFMTRIPTESCVGQFFKKIRMICKFTNVFKCNTDIFRFCVFNQSFKSQKAHIVDIRGFTPLEM